MKILVTDSIGNHTRRASADGDHAVIVHDNSSISVREILDATAPLASAWRWHKQGHPAQEHGWERP